MLYHTLMYMLVRATERGTPSELAEITLHVVRLFFFADAIGTFWKS